MHRSKFDQICSVNEISLGLLRKAHILTRPNNGARALLIQRLKKCWMENQSLLTFVKTIQNIAYGIVLDCFNMREIELDFSRSFHVYYSRVVFNQQRFMMERLRYLLLYFPSSKVALKPRSSLIAPSSTFLSFFQVHGRQQWKWLTPGWQ